VAACASDSLNLLALSAVDDVLDLLQLIGLLVLVSSLRRRSRHAHMLTEASSAINANGIATR